MPKRRTVKPADRIKAEELKESMHIKAGGRCFHCDTQIPLHVAQLAHRIPQWDRLIEKYGEEVIYHEDNMDIVCSLACNKKSEISPKSRPLEVMALADSILKKLEEEKKY
jgi:hypothetical protein